MLPLVAAAVFTLPNYKPSPAELKAAYARADGLTRDADSKSYRLRLNPTWLEGGKRFWYSVEVPGGGREFWTVESATGEKRPAFDDARLARAIGYPVGKPPFVQIEFPQRDKIRFYWQGKRWTVDLNDYTTTSEDAPVPRRAAPEGRIQWHDLNPADRDPSDSPDGRWTLALKEDNVVLGPKGGDLKPITTDGNDKGYYARVFWSPDSSRAIGVRVVPGDRNKVFYVQSSPPEGEHGKLLEMVYDRPGDRIDTFTLHIIDPAAKTVVPLNADTVDYGDVPWIRWRKDGKFTYEKMDRGYGRWRLMLGDAKANTSSALIDENPDTFVDSTSMFREYLDSDEVVHLSERTGWNQLYLTGPSGTTSPITRGNWVVREVAEVDEKNRRVVFAASGIDPKEDPYNLHWYRVDFDGSHMTALTPAPGNHRIQLSPDGESYVDTYSSPVDPPVHELRRTADGALVSTLEKGDIGDLKKSGWRAPEVFVAKGRDGKTDIWGLVFRPRKFNPRKRYPVIEDIYAGPHDSFVPKDFAPNRSMQSLAELGFIVVKIDGMGTRNRGKAFQDVCYKNLQDAGFPDRILWMKTLATKYPQADIDRVGVFGGSAGGQSSTGALLFHPEFYKVAVSSCGCHDNRLDKIWWNEQWMGLIGPHYAAASNIENAAKLKGHLMLMVGELDDNVPPESTYRLADALEKAGKEFELVVLTNQRHTGGGVYGERKRRDFFVRHLLGVEPAFVN